MDGTQELRCFVHAGCGNIDDFTMLGGYYKHHRRVIPVPFFPLLCSSNPCSPAPDMSLLTTQSVTFRKLSAVVYLHNTTAGENLWECIVLSLKSLATCADMETAVNIYHPQTLSSKGGGHTKLWTTRQNTEPASPHCAA